MTSKNELLSIPVAENDKVYESMKLLSPLLKNNGAFIAGGCFKNLFNNETPRDIDVYFRTEEQFKEMNNIFVKSPNYTGLYISKNCVTYKHIKNNILVDLIKKQFGTPEEIINTFDFTVVKFALYIENGIYTTTFHTQFYNDLNTKTLQVWDMPDDIDKFFNRIVKYIRYGYRCPIDLKQKVFNAINKLPNGYTVKTVNPEDYDF